jgi:lipopolysaccharide export system permease protein
VNLISRYILRETFGAWVLVILVLFAILMADQFAQILADAATNALPKEAVFYMLGLTSLRYLTVLSPIALFLAVMLALARLNRDSEMAALAACGIGPAELLRPLSLLTLALALVVAWLSLVQTPDASRRIEELRFRAKASLELGVLEPGKFMTPDSGTTVLYARAVSNDELQDVFVERQNGDRVVVILAARGRRIVDTEAGKLMLILYDGRRYEGIPGESSFRMMRFAEHGIPMRREEQAAYEQAVETKPTQALLGSSVIEDRAELQWRMSAPLSLFVLVFLAVPLSRSSPREGRYARLGVGLLIYITYANTLSIARVWLESGRVPDWLGIWWVHAIVGLIALWLLGRETGWLQRAPVLAAERSAA